MAVAVASGSEDLLAAVTSTPSAPRFELRRRASDSSSGVSVVAKKPSLRASSTRDGSVSTPSAEPAAVSSCSVS